MPTKQPRGMGDMTKARNPTEKSDGWPVWAWLLAAAIVLIIWYLVGWLLPAETGDRGGFGDAFGGVGALFSGLGVVAFAGALTLQRRELTLQRSELRLTRDELKGQKAAVLEQNNVLALQAFESGFFRLLEIHGQERARFRGPLALPSEPGEGQLHAISEEILSRTGPAHDAMATLEVSLNWQQMRGELTGPLGSWLRTIQIDAYISRLAQLVLMLERSPDPEFHADILRASLTADEVVMLLAKALDESTTRLARQIRQHGMADRVSGKVGPSDRVRWIVQVVGAYAESGPAHQS